MTFQKDLKYQKDVQSLGEQDRLFFAARMLSRNHFVIINADDYYGKEAFVKLHDFLVSGEDLGREFTMGMAGFILKNTFK